MAILQTLLEKLQSSKGPDYAVAWHALKAHLNEIGDSQFIAEIAEVTNASVFSELWALGLNYPRQQAAMYQYKQLTGKGSE